MSTLKKAGLALIMAGFSLPAIAAQVNLNKASKEELLQNLEGLTNKQADAIIQYREKEGAIVKIPELVHLGIGPKVIGPNVNKLTVGDVDWGDKKQQRL